MNHENLNLATAQREPDPQPRNRPINLNSETTANELVLKEE